MVKQQKIILYSVGAVATLAIVGAVLVALGGSTSPPPQPTYTASALAALPRADKSSIDTSHLADGLMPPTNHWFTGAVLQHDPKPVFPLPLKFAPTDTQFTFDMPKVIANDKLIQAVDNLPVTVTMQGATHYRVTRYDEVSLDLTYFTADQHQLATVTVAAGSPYIFIASHSDISLNITAQGVSPSRKGSAAVYASGKATMAIAPFAGASIANADNSVGVTAPSGSLVTLFASESSGDFDKLMSRAENRVTGTTVSFKRGSQNYATSIAYTTSNNQPTLYARLPHQSGNASGPKYDTIYGQAGLEEGNKLEYTTPTVPLTSQIDVTKLSDSNKQLLVTTLKQDMSQLQPYPADTYFGGKMVYRDAQLLTIAKQLGENTIASQLQARIHTELSVRFTPSPGSDRSFYYDSHAHGIVGVTPAFGSEKFNDHHFHYGYFIYAASVLAQYDKGFVQQYGDQVNLLVADIANGSTDVNFPIDRMYDPYFGHSWASGDSPFADGNNQESSSEAVNAWIGMGLWANQVGNASMADRAAWLLSGETAGASAYWLNFDTNSAPYNTGYGKSIVALNWGGKRDYATFFSSSPKAMLGIQLIPMSPTTASYLAGNSSRISQNLQQARSDPAGGEQFDDYLLMYQALQGNGASLLDSAKTLPDTAIDNGNSRTYMYAWLLTR